MNNKLKSQYQNYHKRLAPVLKKPKTQAYFVLVLSFFTMAFFGFFAIRPTLRTIFQLNREITDSRKLNDQLTEKINALAAVQADYELIRGAVPALYTALPETAQFPALVFAVEDVARSVNASISALNFEAIEIASASASPKGVQETVPIRFDITFSGTYNQLFEALTLLLNYKRIITLDSVAFSVTPGLNQKGTLYVTFIAKSYYY